MQNHSCRFAATALSRRWNNHSQPFSQISNTCSNLFSRSTVSSPSVWQNFSAWGIFSAGTPSRALSTSRALFCSEPQPMSLSQRVTKQTIIISSSWLGEDLELAMQCFNVWPRGELTQACVSAVEQNVFICTNIFQTLALLLLKHRNFIMSFLWRNASFLCWAQSTLSPDLQERVEIFLWIFAQTVALVTPESPTQDCLQLITLSSQDMKQNEKRVIIIKVISRLQPNKTTSSQDRCYMKLLTESFIGIFQIPYKQIKLTMNESREQEKEQAYILPQRVSCNKHPSKLIDYFCKHPQCSDRLFCSSCLLKKQYCRHDMNPFIIDIAEFMYEQKMSFEMRGLSKEADIHDYLIHRQSRRKMYDDVVDAEITRFEDQLNDMSKSIMKTIEELRSSIIGQLDQFKVTYAQTEEMMVRKVEEAFKNSYMAQFESFEQVVASKDCSTSIGLRQLLQKLVLDNLDHTKVKDIQKLYENLISMHDETPEVDYSRFEGIKSYFTVFQNKLSQAGPLLIGLHKNSNLALTAKDINPSAVLDPLSTVSVAGVKKYAKSATFPSHHSRTVYAICKLPDRKIITGSDDGSLNMFDMTTFEKIGSYQCHVGGVRCMIVLPNNKLVTGSYDKTIKIWPDPVKLGDLSSSMMQLSQVSQMSKKAASNAPILTALKVLSGHTSSIIALRYLNDNTTFASGSADYNIKIWDYEKGENTKNFSGHMSDILCLECTTNGQTLISGSSDRTIKVWSLTKKYSSASIKTLTGHSQAVWTIALLQDDSTLFSSGIDKVIKMWDINSGNLVRNLPSEHSAHVTKLLQLTKELVVSCGNDGNIKFWDFRNNSCAHTLQLEVGISTMAITAEQGIVAIGQDKSIILCD